MPSDLDVWLSLPLTIHLLEKNGFVMEVNNEKIIYRRWLSDSINETACISYHACPIPRISLSFRTYPFVFQHISIEDRLVVEYLLKFNSIA